ncbi:DUF3027 domain-containing protein [Mycolicibacterium aichiense]|uniref:DUF3027 domain-containing protein n=1 Tax=Mycolicibacterium aichiense TaxID=1799 RepID=UPI003D668FFC
MDSTLDAKEATAPAQAAAPSDAVAAVLSGAVEQARQAIVEHSGDTVGEYLGVSFEDETAATHRFLANMPGYQGWQWAVVVAAYEGADHATLSEVVLVPGPTALLAPAWVPWDERIKPGDLSPGDLLAPGKDDLRLAPGYTATGDPLIDDTAFEIGFGRRQVLSALGRDETAQRWHDGDHGPDSPMARATKRVCRDCGFMVPLAGALGTMFGVCCNEMAADSHVVDFEYGCGAHSDTPQPAGTGSPLYDPYDDGVLEVVEVVAETPATAAAPDEPEVPETPETPEVSETPHVPESPAAPESPEAPEASEPGEQA